MDFFTTRGLTTRTACGHLGASSEESRVSHALASIVARSALDGLRGAMPGGLGSIITTMTMTTTPTAGTG